MVRRKTIRWHMILHSNKIRAEEFQVQNHRPGIHLPVHPKSHPKRVYQYKGIQPYEHTEWEKRSFSYFWNYKADRSTIMDERVE